MPDSGAVWDHFAAAISAYRRAAGVETWRRLETDIRELGGHSVFASVHWNALDANGEVVRDTWTSYQLLATPEGWRLHESLLTSLLGEGIEPFRGFDSRRLHTLAARFRPKAGRRALKTCALVKSRIMIWDR